jgi:hypothetical protein
MDKSAPRLTAETRGDRVILHEAEPLFILPVTIEATTAKGIQRRTIWIREEETAFSFDGEFSNALNVLLVAASPSRSRAILMSGVELHSTCRQPRFVALKL